MQKRRESNKTRYSFFLDYSNSTSRQRDVIIVPACEYRDSTEWRKKLRTRHWQEVKDIMDDREASVRLASADMECCKVVVIMKLMFMRWVVGLNTNRRGRKENDDSRKKRVVVRRRIWICIDRGDMDYSSIKTVANMNSILWVFLEWNKTENTYQFQTSWNLSDTHLHTQTQKKWW